MDTLEVVFTTVAVVGVSSIGAYASIHVTSYRVFIRLAQSNRMVKSHIISTVLEINVDKCR